MKTGDLILVDWVDASFQGDGQLRPEDLVPGVWVQTAGFLVRQDRKSVSVALERSEDFGFIWRHVANIPRQFIRKTRPLTRTTPSRDGRQVVHIKWIDASFQEGQYDTDEVTQEPVQVETTGILSAENKNWMSLALSYFDKNHRPWKYVAHVRKNYIVKERRFRL